MSQDKPEAPQHDAGAPPRPVGWTRENVLVPPPFPAPFLDMLADNAHEALRTWLGRAGVPSEIIALLDALASLDLVRRVAERDGGLKYPQDQIMVEAVAELATIATALGREWVGSGCIYNHGAPPAPHLVGQWTPSESGGEG